MKKFMLVLIFTLSLLAVTSISLGVTGLFFKVTTPSLYPADAIEQNFTVEKFYNLSVRVQRYGSSSYLTIRNSNTTLLLLDENLTEVGRITGMDGSYTYGVMDKRQLDRVKFVSAYNLNNSLNTYEDVEGQAVDVSYSGLRARIIIRTNQIITGEAVVSGFVTDALTGQRLDGIVVYAFEANANTNTSLPVAQNSTLAGQYTLVLSTNSRGQSFDLYVEDYELSAV